MDVADGRFPELTLDLRRSLLTIRLAFFLIVPCDEFEELSLSSLLELDDEELDESKTSASTPGCDSSSTMC